MSGAVTVRIYAAEKLAAAGEAETTRAGHRDWYLGWLDATPLERLTFAPATIRAVAGELDNLRASADWCLGEDRPDLRAAARWWRAAVEMSGRIEESGWLIFFGGG